MCFKNLQYMFRSFDDRTNRDSGRDHRSDRDTTQRVDRQRISPHQRTSQREPPRRESRSDWKQDSRSQPAHRDSSRGKHCLSMLIYPENRTSYYCCDITMEFLCYENLLIFDLL